jgi:hypothetical protein
MDITALVAGAINAWLATLATQLLDPAVAAVSVLLFRTPSFTAIPAVSGTWGLVRGVADALFVLAWLAAGLSVMTRGGTDARYAAKTVIPRVALAAILANASLVLCGAFIALNNALVDAVLSPSPAEVIGRAFASLLGAGHPATDLLAVVVAVAAAVLALVLVAVFIGRAFLLLLAVCVAPLALAAHALPQTDEIAHLWWRTFAGLLFVQVIEAVLVRVASDVLASGAWLGGAVPDLVSGLAVVTLLHALVRLPFVAYAWAFRSSFARGPVASVIAVGARTLAAVR